jgi:hypothetical protein
MLRRVRRVLPSLLLIMLAVASCGGSGDEADVEAMLDRAFSEELRSADLKLEAEVQLEGSTALDRPLRIQATGPFRTNDRKIPSVDLELQVGTAGAGQTITTGFLSTGDRAFLKFQDVYYERPPSEVRRANRALARGRGRAGSFRALGLDPRSWLIAPEDEGEEEVAGVPTRHLSGALDVEAMLLDINRFLRKSGSAVDDATGERAPDPLSRAEIREITEVVTDPSFDVYVGKQDDIVRRVSGRIEVDIPQDRREEFHGIESGTIQFSVELSDVNGEQEIEAPARARPMSTLTRSLGGGELLPGLGSGPDAPDDEPGGAPSGGEEETSPEAERFREYADCLDEARPEDTDALQRCAELLHRP